MESENWHERLRGVGYLAEESFSLMVHLAVALHRPLLLEGPAGSGKTYLAHALAQALRRPLVRLSCYEGIDASQALYDWNYQRQLATLAQNTDVDLYGEQFLMERPLLRALREPDGSVLLIDEVDRADEGFEAMLLEFLADYQLTIPEQGTIRSRVTPVTILTSNRQRPLSDALRRRCLYLYVDWPQAAREREIVQWHVSDISPDLVESIVNGARCMRQLGLLKPPGMAETVDWARAQKAMGFPGWDVAWVKATLGCVIKDHLDFSTVLPNLEQVVAGEP